VAYFVAVAASYNQQAAALGIPARDAKQLDYFLGKITSCFAWFAMKSIKHADDLQGSKHPPGFPASQGVFKWYVY